MSPISPESSISCLSVNSRHYILTASTDSPILWRLRDDRAARPAANDVFAFDRSGFFSVKRQPRVCVFLVSGVRSDVANAPHRLNALFSGSVFFMDNAVTRERMLSLV